jgi:Cerato-platanin
MIFPAVLVFILAFLFPFAQAACDDPEVDPHTDPHAYSAQPSPLRATFDYTFDNPSGSMNGVACSNGVNGLAARYPVFGDLPTFPYIGGAWDVVWNSPHCGSCWYITNPETGVSIYMTAIDTAGAGFNMAKQAFDTLTGGPTGQGAIDVTAYEVPRWFCGI